MGKKRKNKKDSDDLVIKATSDLFIAALLSAPKNEPILRGIINAVLVNKGHVPIKKAKVPNPYKGARIK